jgi:hypothetical protein
MGDFDWNFPGCFTFRPRRSDNTAALLKIFVELMVACLEPYNDIARLLDTGLQHGGILSNLMPQTDRENYLQ